MRSYTPGKVIERLLQPHAVYRTRFPGHKIALSGGLHDRLVPGGSRIVGRRWSWISCEGIFPPSCPLVSPPTFWRIFCRSRPGKSPETLRGHTSFAVMIAVDEGESTVMVMADAAASGLTAGALSVAQRP